MEAISSSPCLRAQGRDVLHRARPIERHQRDDVLDRSGFMPISALRMPALSTWNTPTVSPRDSIS
jgi:hypothetical protein